MISRPALAVISAAILAYEVLLVRLFAIVQWHHFAFMAISVALLGFGIGGALLSVFRPWVLPRGAVLFEAAATLFALGAPVAFLLAERLPFNALAVVWAPSQLLYLGVIYLLLAVPFTAGAVCVGLAFVEAGAAPGRVYLWNLLGSGAGALGVVALLLQWPPMTCLVIVAASGLAAAVIGAIGRRTWRGSATITGIAAVGALTWGLASPAGTALRVSEFRDLSQALAAEDAHVVAERSGPLALVSVVESPMAPFRYAPGLSILSPALPPPQLGLFADSNFAGAIDAWDGDPASLAYLRHSTDALPYRLAQHPDVLVLGAGGGRAVRQAIAHGAARIDSVELNPDLLRLVGETFAAEAGQLYAQPQVATHAADPRHFLAQGAGRWDIVAFPLTEGTRGLGESYLHTVEAFGLAYDRLAPNGWLSLTGPVDLPPRVALKLVSTLRAALKARGIERPGDRLLMIRGMSTVTLLAKKGAVSARDTAETKAFAQAEGFDLVHYPGMEAGEANRRNRLARPAFFEAVAALLGPDAQAFIAAYKFDIAPATDDRPYFFDFFTWAALPELLSLGPAGGAALLQLGELIVAATLVQALVLGIVLVLLPLGAARYRGKSHRIAWRFGAYFTLLGLGFMFVEIAWIQKFGLFLGHPLYAVSVVLTGFLVFAGLGAGLSARLERALATAPVSAIDVATGSIGMIALGYLALLPALFGSLSGLPDTLRVAVALVLVGPLAFCMGMPFPLGLARVARADPDFVPWAWGLNGCASVVSATAATLLTMHSGFSATVVTAVGLYLIAAMVLRASDQGEGSLRR